MIHVNDFDHTAVCLWKNNLREVKKQCSKLQDLEKPRNGQIKGWGSTHTTVICVGKGKDRLAFVYHRVKNMVQESASKKEPSQRYNSRPMTRKIT